MAAATAAVVEGKPLWFLAFGSGSGYTHLLPPTQFVPLQWCGDGAGGGCESELVRFEIGCTEHIV